MENADPEFIQLLKDYDLPKLEEHAAATYGLWSDWRLAYLNPAWFRFAAENGGVHIAKEWPRGANLMKVLPPDLLEFYRSNYQDCLQHHRTWAHAYECSSAEQYRVFHQVAYPLGRGEGLLIVNSLTVEQPHDPAVRSPRQPDATAYRDEDGFLHMCSGCRMSKRQHAVGCWDWVPAWVHRPPTNTSHTLCPTCLGYYTAKLSP